MKRTYRQIRLDRIKRLKEQKERSLDLEINEKLLDIMISKFLHENYKNVKRFKLDSCTLTRESKLKLEGTIKFKSGNSRVISFLTDSVDLKNKKIEVRAISEAFTNSKAFKFTFRIKENMIRPEKMVYYYTTRYKGTPYQVEGSVYADRKPIR